MNLINNSRSIDGGSVESLNFHNYPEFDDGDLYKSRNQQQTEGMAPTTTIETITITRPLKVIAFICGIIVVVLMLMALTSTDWLLSSGWRQGLFVHCISDDAELPLPFNLDQQLGQCFDSRDKFYIKATAILCVITLITDAIATILTGFGLKTLEANLKYKFYRIAVLVMIVSLLSLLVALILYPVCFATELSQGNRTVWEFGWAYGVGWGAAIFLFGAVVLLLCDKESEEIYYKERKIVHEASAIRD
ncbi:hypothetical protein ACKWTF_006050 [Chironomus riparius]